MYKDSRGSIISIVGTIDKYICIVFQYTYRFSGYYISIERNRSRFNSLSISVFDCTDEIYPIIEYVFDNFPQVRWVAHLLVLSCLKDRITQRGCYHLRSCPPEYINGDVNDHP